MIKRSVPCGGRFFVQVGESDGKEGAFLAHPSKDDWNFRGKVNGNPEKKLINY